MDKKTFNILECATDLGISINEGKLLSHLQKKRKKNRKSRWNSFIQIYPIIQEYSDLDFVDLVRLPWWKWKQSRKKSKQNVLRMDVDLTRGELEGLDFVHRNHGRVLNIAYGLLSVIL